MKRLVVLGALSCALYLLLLAIPHWGREFPRILLLHGGLVLLWLAGFLVVRRGTPPGGAPLAVIFGFAVGFRVITLFAAPTLSDDLYRYLWDGRVLLEGINPYRYAPPAPELAALRDASWALINNPTLPTIYPPLLMVVFAAVAAISPTVFAMKAAMALFDLAAGGMLIRALRAAGRSPAWAVLYLWHPLVVMEFAGQGHADAVGVFLVSAALAAWFTRRALVAGALLALAGMVKFLPWSALPALVSRLRWRWLLLPLVPALLYAPFMTRDVSPLGSLPVYAQKWRSNDFLFGGLVAAVEPSVPEAPFQDETGVTIMPEDLALRRARLLGGALVLGVWLLTLALRRPWYSVYAWSVGALLLVSPVVHPWYLVWLLPSALFLPHPGWWAWSVLGILAYAPLPRYLAEGAWVEQSWLKALEYLPVLILVLVQIGLERRDPGLPGGVQRGGGGTPPEVSGPVSGMLNP